MKNNKEQVQSQNNPAKFENENDKALFAHRQAEIAKTALEEIKENPSKNQEAQELLTSIVQDYIKMQEEIADEAKEK